MDNAPKFVGRFERAAMQYIILSKAQQQNEVTKEHLQNVFRGNLQPISTHLDECLQTLTQDGHLKQEGNKYRITDDGREDVQKLQNVVIELNQYAGAGTRNVPEQTKSGGNVR